MTELQQTGILLIDWENLVNAFGKARCEVQVLKLARSLIARATEAAHQNGLHGLGYSAVYAPARALSEGVTEDLTTGGLAVVPTLRTKEAADLRITVEAIDRYHKGYRFFIFATGDADFVPVCRWLVERTCTVVVWHGQPDGGLSPDLIAYKPRQWVLHEDFIGCEEIDPSPPPGSRDLFILMIQRMYDTQQQNLWSYLRAIPALAQMGKHLGGDTTLTEEQIKFVWDEALNIDNVLREYQHRIPGQERIHHRKGTNFNNDHVAELFRVCDSVLAKVGSQNQQGPCSLALLTQGQQGNDLQRTETLIGALVSTGYLNEEYETYSLTWNGYRHGIVNGLRSAILVTLGLQIDKDRQTVSQWSIISQWQRTYKPGGKLHGEQERRSEEEAKRTFKRARSEGVLDSARIGEYWGWYVVENHYLVKQAIAEARKIAKTVANLQDDLGRGPTISEVSEQLPGTRGSEVDFWLGALASEKVLSLLKSDGDTEPHAKLNNRSKFARWLLE